MELTPEQRAELIEALAQENHEACCGDHRAGIRVGASVVLGIFQVEMTRELSKAISDRENELYREAREEREKARGG